MIRIGIHGCGRIARMYHLEILARVPDVEIAALAESDETARRAAASHLHSGRSLAVVLAAEAAGRDGRRVPIPPAP